MQPEFRRAVFANSTFPVSERKCVQRVAPFFPAPRLISNHRYQYQFSVREIVERPHFLILSLGGSCNAHIKETKIRFRSNTYLHPQFLCSALANLSFSGTVEHCYLTETRPRVHSQGYWDLSVWSLPVLPVPNCRFRSWDQGESTLAS